MYILLEHSLEMPSWQASSVKAHVLLHHSLIHNL